ncbi:hypothetical protein AMK59_2833, partial [Oryctes borbonicus]
WDKIHRFQKMLCSSIKLTDRREFRQEKTPKRNRSTMLEEKLFMKSDYYHSYTFRWDKPKKHHYSCNNPQFLAIKEIKFPESLSRLNDPPPKEWLKKTPRIKSIDTIPKMNENDFDNEEGLSISVLTDQLSRETEELIEEIKSSVNFEDDENDIDPDIQQLIASARETEDDIQEEAGDKPTPDDNTSKKIEKKRKHLKKKEKKYSQNEEKKEKKQEMDKEGEKDKDKVKTRTKTIKFSLSKPPTPQTLQIIRVDVTSNLSMEEELPETYRTGSSNISDCSKGCGMKILKNKEIKENLHRKMSASKELSSNEVNFMCRRLILKDRSDDIANSSNN